MNLRPAAQQPLALAQTASGRRSKVNVKKAVRSACFCFSPFTLRDSVNNRATVGGAPRCRNADAVFIACALMWFGCFLRRGEAGLFFAARRGFLLLYSCCGAGVQAAARLE